MRADDRLFGSVLTRREALALLGVGGLTALAPRRSVAQPVETSSCVARSMPDIALAAKRYDGGRSSASFTGCIPLAPGQLFEAGVAGGRQLTMSLWNGVMEIGSYFTCLYPQHPDGSVKVLRVSTTLTLAPGVEQALTLKLGTAATVLGPAQHPTINAAWMKFPLLIGCTDASHLCAARVAPGPLVPIDHPGLPAGWRDFLTKQFDGSEAHWPNYGLALTRLRSKGDMGQKLATLTANSAVVTDITGSWPTPTAAPTALLKAGTVVTGPGGQGIPPGTTIKSIDSPTQLTLTKNATVNGRLALGFGPGYPWQGANYNGLAPLYYRYLTTGVLDKLREAHLLAQDLSMDSFGWNGLRTQMPHIGVINYGNGLVKYHADYEGTPAGTDFPVDEYGEPLNPNPVGGAEWQSGFTQSAWICYVLSGWPQTLGILASFGLRALGGTWGGVQFGAPNSPPDTEPGGSISTAGIRLTWRVMRERDLFYYLLSLPMALRQAQNVTTIGDSPRTPEGKQKYHVYLKAKYYDAADAWSKSFQPGQPNSFLAGIWGYRPTYAATQGAEAGASPNFQSLVLFHTLLWCYMNVVEDERVLTKLAEHATFLLSQVRGPHQVVFGNQGRITFYSMPYMTRDPKAIDQQDGTPTRPWLGMNPYTPAMLLPLWVWGWRVTGNPKFLELADALATVKAHLYSGTPPTGIGHAFKQLGECYSMAFFAAAWRAGATWGVVSGELPPKPIPRCP